MRSKLLIALWYWLPLVAYAATIFAVSSMSSLPLPSLELPLDKVAHLLEYAGFGALLCRALTMGGAGLTPRAAFFAAISVGALYAAGDELHQSFVPSRDADPYDFFVDCLGTTLGAGGMRALGLRRSRRRESSPAP